jgi:hypothetical protein
MWQCLAGTFQGVSGSRWTIPAAMKLPQRRGIYNIHAPGFADEYVPEQVPSILELAVNAHIFLSA